MKCIVCGKKYGEHDIGLFTFPVGDLHRFSEWLSRLGLTNEDITPSSRVCSDHFPPDAMNLKTQLKSVPPNRRPKRTLNPNALPYSGGVKNPQEQV